MPIEYKNSFQLKAYNFKYNQKNIRHFCQKDLMFPANTLNVFSQNIQPFQAKTYNDSDSKRHKKIRHICQR